MTQATALASSIAIHCAYTRLAPPQELKPNPDNPNRHSAHQSQLLAAIIQESGWRHPITISKRSGLVVSGHGRLDAALLLSCELVPIDEQEFASEAEELAVLVADNRLAELAELDRDGLAAVMAKIGTLDPEFDLDLTGFEADQRAALSEVEALLEDEERIPKMECQAFEHHDFLVFMFHDLRDFMLALQGMGVGKVDASISRTAKKIGIGRVMDGKRLLARLQPATPIASLDALANSAARFQSEAIVAQDEASANLIRDAVGMLRQAATYFRSRAA
jgi:hypothetical protein